MGISHVRGMLLYGLPGCGKTLIARQIGKVLNAREPKIVNGPEVLDKYVGVGGKIRELFADAEAEQQSEGDRSMLHTIIFDEMDVLAVSRALHRWEACSSRAYQRPRRRDSETRMTLRVNVVASTASRRRGIASTPSTRRMTHGLVSAQAICKSRGSVRDGHGRLRLHRQPITQ